MRCGTMPRSSNGGQHPAPAPHERPVADHPDCSCRCRSGRRGAPPARDSVQLHLVLGPRDRHPPARPARLGRPRPAARRAPHRPLGAHAVRGAGRHLGGPAQSLPAGRPARQPAPARPADRGAAPPPRRGRQAAHAVGRPGPRRGRRRAAGAFPGRGRGLRGPVPRRLRPQEADRPRPLARDRQGQHQVRRPVARLARHRRDRLARRVPVRGAHAGHRGGDGRPGRRLHRARPDHHPARRRHRLHRRRGAVDLVERGHQHREARGDERGRDDGAARRR